MKRFFYITMAFMLCFLSFIPVSYAELPSNLPPLEMTSDIDYRVYYKYGEYNYIIDFQSNGSFDLDAVYDGDEIVTFSVSNNEYAVYYILRTYSFNTKRWDTNGTIQLYPEQPKRLAIDSLLDSTITIYNEDGTIFFQPPPTKPHQILAEVTKEEMVKAQSNLVGTMRTLALCGVGLIALLMVLPLFGKVFRIFRVK